MKSLTKVLAVLQLPGLLALAIGPWVEWLVLPFFSIPLALVTWAFVIWTGIEAFIAPFGAFDDSGKRKRLMGNLRRLLAGGVIGIVFAAVVLHPETDQHYRLHLIWLLGFLPTVLALAVDVVGKE